MVGGELLRSPASITRPKVRPCLPAQFEVCPSTDADQFVVLERRAQGARSDKCPGEDEPRQRPYHPGEPEHEREQPNRGECQPGTERPREIDLAAGVRTKAREIHARHGRPATLTAA